MGWQTPVGFNAAAPYAPPEALLQTDSGGPTARSIPNYQPFVNSYELPCAFQVKAHGQNGQATHGACPSAWEPRASRTFPIRAGRSATPKWLSAPGPDASPRGARPARDAPDLGLRVGRLGCHSRSAWAPPSWVSAKPKAGRTAVRYRTDQRLLKVLAQSIIGSNVSTFR